jgi:hypothetical protein
MSNIVPPNEPPILGTPALPARGWSMAEVMRASCTSLDRRHSWYHSSRGYVGARRTWLPSTGLLDIRRDQLVSDAGANGSFWARKRARSPLSRSPEANEVEKQEEPQTARQKSGVKQVSRPKRAGLTSPCHGCNLLQSKSSDKYPST